MEFQRLRVEDAQLYLDQVKYIFENQPQVYNDFLDIMKELLAQSIDTPSAVQRVANLFRGHSELIVGFNTFLPPGYRIEVQPNEQVQVIIPGSSVGGTGPTTLTIHPTGSPTTSIQPLQPVVHQPTPSGNHTPTQHSTSPGAAVPKAPSHTVANNQPHSNAQSYNLNFPSHSSGSSPSSTTHSPPNNFSQQAAIQPVEFNRANNYVHKVKNRFQGQPDIYMQFLKILHTYHTERMNIKNGVHTAAKPLTEGEVYAQVAKLFQNQEDLLQEFGQFLTDENDAANVGLTPSHTVANNQPHSNAQSYNQSSPSHSSGSSPPFTTHSPPNNSQQAASQPVTVLSPMLKSCNLSGNTVKNYKKEFGYARSAEIVTPVNSKASIPISQSQRVIQTIARPPTIMTVPRTSTVVGVRSATEAPKCVLVIPNTCPDTPVSSISQASPMLSTFVNSSNSTLVKIVPNAVTDEVVPSSPSVTKLVVLQASSNDCETAIKSESSTPIHSRPGTPEMEAHVSTTAST